MQVKARPTVHYCFYYYYLLFALQSRRDLDKRRPLWLQPQSSLLFPAVVSSLLDYYANSVLCGSLPKCFNFPSTTRSKFTCQSCNR